MTFSRLKKKKFVMTFKKINEFVMTLKNFSSALKRYILMNLIPRVKFIAWEVLTHYLVILLSKAGYLKANAEQFVKIKSKLENFLDFFITM